MIELLLGIISILVIYVLIRIALRLRIPLPAHRADYPTIILSDGTEFIISHADAKIFKPGDTIRYVDSKGNLETSDIIEIK